MPKKSKFSLSLSTILSICLITSVAIAGFLVYQNTLLRKMLADNISATPIPTIEPTPTPDPAMNWTVYENEVQKYSFKYPPTWDINTKDADLQTNSVVQLIKDDATINIYASMDGIGGKGREYQGEEIMLDGNKLYQYEVENAHNFTKTVGITDELTESLGLFKLNNKTYSITLTYPASWYPETETEIKTEFNQILSTFKLTGTESSKMSLSDICLSYPTAASITDCGSNTYGVVSSLLGGGTTYIKPDGTKVTCPVVGPDSVTPECKELAKLTCKEVSCSLPSSPEATNL